MDTRTVRRSRALLVALAFIASLAPALVHADDAAHHDPVAPVLITLAVVLAAAKLGAEAASRLGQAAVLGEIVVGVLLGNVDLLGYAGFEWMADDPSVDLFARLGVLLLLFEVGLESTIGQMMRVGASSLLVAVLGVAVPFALGWGVGAVLLPDAGPYGHAFLGATLTATSVGITARVLKDLGRAQSSEARIILGAAVIDDVLGLVILAVVTGLIGAANAGRSASMGELAVTMGSALGFLVGALVIGAWLTPKVFRFASWLQTEGVLIAFGLSFCFLLAYLANAIGLAPIVGAFAAGLILEPAHFQRFVDRGEQQLEELLAPITSFLVPVFFVIMGMRTDLRAFANLSVLGLALAITLVAVLGKQVCGLGVLGRGIDRLTVGIGMVPRGEVGLIFANIGLGLSIGGERVLSQAGFSAIVVMVIITTMITPPLLAYRLSRTAAG